MTTIYKTSCQVISTAQKHAVETDCEPIKVELLKQKNRQVKLQHTEGFRNKIIAAFLKKCIYAMTFRDGTLCSQS